jgi:hypothetical protein
MPVPGLSLARYSRELAYYYSTKKLVRHPRLTDFLVSQGEPLFGGVLVRFDILVYRRKSDLASDDTHWRSSLTSEFRIVRDARSGHS